MSNQNDNWRTPQWMFDWLNELYSFDIDLCACKESAKVDNFFSLEENALKKDWIEYGDVGFCNPPYSNRGEWIDLAANQAIEGMTTIMTIPALNGQKFVPKVIDGCSKIISMIGRVGYVHYDTLKIEDKPKFATIVVEFSPKVYQRQLEYVVTQDIKKKFGG